MQIRCIDSVCATDVLLYLMDEETLRLSTISSVARRIINEAAIEAGIVSICKGRGKWTGLWQYIKLWEVAIHLSYCDKIHALSSHEMTGTPAIRAFPAAAYRAVINNYDHCRPAAGEPLIFFAVFSFSDDDENIRAEEAFDVMTSSKVFCERILCDVYLKYRKCGNQYYFGFGADMHFTNIHLNQITIDQSGFYSYISGEEEFSAALPQHGGIQLNAYRHHQLNADRIVEPGSQLFADITFGSPIPVVFCVGGAKHVAWTGCE